VAEAELSDIILSCFCVYHCCASEVYPGVRRNVKRAGQIHGVSVEGAGNKGSQVLKDVCCIGKEYTLLTQSQQK